MIRAAATLGLVLLLTTGSGVSSWAVADEPPQAAIYEALSSKHLLATRFDPVLKAVLDTLMAASDVQRPARLNQPYAAGAVNVYVVDKGDTADGTTVGADARLRDTMRYVNDNALAFPPDTIVFDVGLLADYLVNAWNVELATVQGVDEANAREAIGVPHEQAFDVVQTFGVLQEVYRFNNLRRAREGLEDRAHRIAVAGMLVDSASASGGANMFAFALAPIFYHELGHLQQGSAGSWSVVDFIGDIAREFASPKILARENAADDFAGRELQRLEASTQGGQEKSMPDKLSRYEGLASTVMWMRDSVLFDVFEGFRGLRAEDHFVNLFHEDCRSKPSTAKLDFYDPQKIAYAFQNYVPIFTAEEFAQLRRKTLATVRAGTHAHNFVRGSRLVDAVDAMFDLGHDDNFMAWYLSFLEAMQKNDPAALADSAADYAKELGLGFGIPWVAKTFDLKFDPAATCPPGLCSVGTFRDGRPGYVEIAGPAENVLYLRLVFPLFQTGPDGGLLDKGTGPGQGSIDFLRRFIVNTLDYPDSDPAVVGAKIPFDELPSILRKCHAFGVGLTAGTDRSVLLSTLNPDFWVSVEVRHRAQ
jgi:hypothetical protein